jgi:hypothetical protein
MADAKPTPRVFISYSWTDQTHVDWVISLAERLLGDGVDVILDKWNLKEGQDLHAFMEQMVTDASVSRVLAVCDKLYAEKANGRRGGVGTETQIISTEVYAKVKQEKFIPLVRQRDEEGNACLPVYFSSRFYLDFSDDEKFGEAYDSLLRNIYERPERPKPPIGEPPAHLFVTDAPHVKPAGRLERLKDAVKRGKPHTQAMLREYLEIFRDSLEDFRITHSGKSAPPFDQQIVDSITAFLPYRDSFIDCLLFVSTYMNDEESYDSIHDFLQDVLAYQFRRDDVGSSYEVDTENYKFVLREIFLYMVAILIKTKRFAAAARFIETEYSYTDTVGGTRFRQGGIGAFDNYCRMLEEHRKQRLNLNVHTVVGQLLYERATRTQIKFRDILQADVLMFIRPYFPQPGATGNWYPRTLVYAGRGGSLELFARATTEAGFRPLKELLKVKTQAEFGAQLKAMLENENIRRFSQSERYWHMDWGEMLNLSRLLPKDHM